ncbi:sulfite exporter TauE/SafE family protein [bacterium]|nr:sulfite exporter TauE/SafE family protein [bacterium]
MMNDLFAVIVIICVAAILQSISGFGFSLLAMPLLSVVVDIREAVVIATICGLFSNVVHVTKDHQMVERSIARRISFSALLGMPLGVLLLSVFSAMQMRVCISVVTIVLVVLMMFKFSIKKENTKVDVVLGVISGVLATSVSTNGPPLIFLLQSKRLDSSRFRATLAYVFTVSGCASFAVLMAAGKGSVAAFQFALLSIPSMYLGTLLGRRARSAVTQEAFQRLTYVLLLTTAGSTALAAFF